MTFETWFKTTYPQFDPEGFVADAAKAAWGASWANAVAAANNTDPAVPIDPTACPECKQPGAWDDDSKHVDGCETIRGRRGWRQLGVYDG